VWRRREERAQDPRLARMRRLLGRADRRARRRGFERRPNETLHQFARRLRQGAEGLGPAAAWYSRYAEARFSCRLTDAVVADLARTLPRA